VKSIWVAGDFFYDEFNIGRYRGEGPRFLIDETVTRPGGAANTLANARAICRNSAIKCQATGYSQPKVLRRWIQDDKTIFEYWDYQGGVTDPWEILNKKDPSFHGAREFNTLVVSEYNKGFSKCDVTNAAVFDLLVVDSRYKTAPIKELKHLTQTSIWRCTGTEYNERWAEHFDWVVHTNHAERITVFQPNEQDTIGNLSAQIDVPELDIVDPVGAGDTFTAALAAHLTNAGVVEFETLVNATRFAVAAAQNACAKKFTAKTDVRLEK